MSNKYKNEILFYKLLIAILTAITFILIFNEPSQYQFTELFWNKSADIISSSQYLKNKYVEIHTSYANERKTLLHKYDINNLFFALQVVEANCPFRVRLGVLTDGGKWICNPMILKNSKECIVYSFGLSGESSFEFALRNVTETRCKIRAIDINKPPNYESLKTIADVFITKVSAKTNTTTQSTSFTDIIGHFGDKSIEILKMDIEGAEFDIIDQILVIPICQISMEVHSEDVSKIVALLEKISQHGFNLFSVEQNPYARHLIEYSFIHDSCMDKYGAFMLAKYLS